MHEAYDITHLLTVSTQIEAIAAYDNNLLVGTRLGCLIVYSLSPGKGNVKFELHILHYCKNFSKKPIQQIDVIPEDNLLLCLTDNVLSTYRMTGSNFPLVHTFEQTKGASLFALDHKPATSLTGQSSAVVRLCVAVRRKLQLYYGKDGKFKQHLFDFTTPDVPRQLAWGQLYLWAGYKAEYTVYDLSTGNPLELFPTSSSKSQEPTMCRYTETSFLLGRDQTSILVEETREDRHDGRNDGRDDGKENKIIIKNQKSAKWKETPICVVWDELFVLGLLENEVIVQTLEPPLFIQSLQNLNKARLMYRCKRGLIYIASVGQVWCLSLADFTKQCQQLVKDKQFQLAIDLMTLSECSKEEKEQKIQSIQYLYAIELFDDKEYARSMREFMKLNTDPVDVIGLLNLDGKNDGEHVKNLRGKDLEDALNALIDYLVDLRAMIGKGGANGSPEKQTTGQSQRNVTQQLELIDTTLLKCYLQTNDAFVAPLLRLNNCRLEETEKTLLQHGKYSELIILYQTKGQHTKALQLLKEHSKQPDSSLEGYRATKNYLQHLGADHLNLIFKFSDWILKEHPEEGLKIFTEDIVEVENLPRPKVLDFLLREHEHLVISYLEHIIYTWSESSPLFHDALINLYRAKITKKDADNKITEQELRHTRAKLIKFLEESTHYTPERVLLHFPADSLFEERAIVLGRLERHEQALAIYVLILGDIEKAIDYCENVSDESEEQYQDVYVILMKIILNPDKTSALSGPLAKVSRHPKTAVPNLEAALSILEKNARRISPLKALAVLPDSVPLARLKRFLQSSLDNQLTLKRQVQVLKGLRYAEHKQIQEMKQFYESKSVVINDYNVCPICKKRFGNQSAFVRYPGGEILHYSCRVDK